jgi:hypothetical protein
VKGEGGKGKVTHRRKDSNLGDVKSIALFLVLSVPGLAVADSPLTSTPFHEAYLDVKIVKYALKKGELDKKIGNYLLKASNPIDVKLAAINAIGWDLEGQHNAEVFKGMLKAKYPNDPLGSDPGTQTVDELICLAYLTAMDDYFNPDNALPIVQEALTMGSKSYTVQMIAALIKAQQAFDYDWCRVYQYARAVDFDSALTRDMRPEATTIIMDYMNLYRGECE